MVESDPAIVALDALIADVIMKQHALATGRVAVRVVVDGHETEFHKLSAADLDAHLARLQAQRDALLTGAATSGAIGIVF